MFVAKADELKGIRAIDECFVRAPQQPGGARGSGIRLHAVGAGGSGRGQASDLLTAIVDTAGSVVDSATQIMTGVVSSGLSLLADMYASDEDGEKQTVIDVDAESAAAELQRMKELKRKWTGKVWNGQVQQYEDVVLPEPLVHGIESVVKEKSAAVCSRIRERKIETKKRRMKWRRRSLQGRITGRMRIRTKVTSPPAAWCVCLPCSLARILIQILWGGTTKRTRMWVGRLPEMTRLRRAGPVNDFVDNDPLK